MPRISSTNDRNIYFRDCAKVPAQPYSSLDSWHPEDLWKWMDGQREAGNELLAISHNANLSDGWMYPVDTDSLGRPIDSAWAASRDRNERLIEMKQIKGQSETHPLLSPNDEFANYYEIMSFLIGLPADSGRLPAIVGSYARQALKDGLSMQDARGYNPYKFGFVSGSDSHNSGAPYRQNNFFGGHGINDGTIETRMAGHIFTGVDVRWESPAGLSGIWAEENTRESLWDAMHRMMLLVGSPWMLVKTVTAFTVGHSITLAAATLGYVRPPAPPIEAAIAMSILFLGVEIVRAYRGETSFTIRHPWIVALAFGLLHGFGFAGALTAAGLPSAAVPLALVSFNVGVELGQLAFVVVVLLLAAGLRHLGIAWPKRAELVPAYLVGTLGAFWLLQRLAFL